MDEHTLQSDTRRHYPPGIVQPSRRCAWEAAERVKLPETNTSSAAVLGAMLKFLDEEIGQRLGYLWMLRDGNLLGALRHGGLIPGDRDLDAAVLIPLDEGLDELKSAFDARLEALGHPFSLQVNDDGRSRWLVLLSPNADERAEPHHADVIVYPSARFDRPRSSLDGSSQRQLVHATTWQQRSFSALCHCSHWPLSRANCFENAPAYLTGVYGDFRTPSGVHAHGASTLEEVYM